MRVPYTFDEYRENEMTRAVPPVSRRLFMTLPMAG